MLSGSFDVNYRQDRSKLSDNFDNIIQNKSLVCPHQSRFSEFMKYYYL